MIILAGRVDVRWSRFEVRQHSRSWKLSPFGTNDTAQQLLSRHKEYFDLAKEVYHLTSGHPLNNRIVADYLQVLQKGGVAIQAGVVKKYEKQIIRNLREDFIDQVVMKSISSDRLKEALQLIAPLRRFDLDLLSQLIDKFSLPYGGPFGVLVLRGDMIKSQLVAYDEHRKALALDPTVRRILALSMRYFETERYREVNKFALHFNICCLRQSSGTDRTLFTNEILYHRANLLILEGKSVEEVGKLLKQDLLKLESEMTLGDAELLQAEVMITS